MQWHQLDHMRTHIINVKSKMPSSLQRFSRRTGGQRGREGNWLTTELDCVGVDWSAVDCRWRLRGGRAAGSDVTAGGRSA